MRPCPPALPRRGSAIATALTLLVGLPGCGLTQLSAPRVRPDHCSTHLSTRVMPPAANQPGTAQAVAAAGYSPAARQLAEDIGLTGPLAALAEAERQPGNGIAYLLARQ